MVTPGGLEPPAYGLGNRRSILLSYGVTSLFCNICGGKTIAQWRHARGLAAGMDDCITKPFQPSVPLAKLSEVSNSAVKKYYTSTELYRIRH